MDTIRVITYQSTEYLQQVELRTIVLRTPLGLHFSKEDLEKDADNIMLGYFDGEKLIGCCQLLEKGGSVFQLRQMAVDFLYQGKHIGQQLVEGAEAYVLSHGGLKIELHARKVALGFYEKLGYHKEGNEFTEVGIPHFQMSKLLS